MGKKSLSVLKAVKTAGMRIEGHILWFQNNCFSFLTIQDGIVYNKAAPGTRPWRGLFFCDLIPAHPDIF
jgi:hypothetical protein